MARWVLVLVATACAEHPIKHGFFATASVDESASLNVPSQGDLWPSCWSDDDALYVANGDGTGFSDQFSDIVVSRISVENLAVMRRQGR